MTIVVVEIQPLPFWEAVVDRAAGLNLGISSKALCLFLSQLLDGHPHGTTSCVRAISIVADSTSAFMPTPSAGIEQPTAARGRSSHRVKGWAYVGIYQRKRCVQVS